MRIIPQQQTIFPSENRFQKRTLFKGAPEDFGKLLCTLSNKQKISAFDWVDLHKEFRKSLREIIDKKRLINHGFFNSVYKIDENFVAKIRNSAVNSLWKISGCLSRNQTKFKQLNTYYGEEVFDLGGVKILKNAGEHTPAGIPEIELKNIGLECDRYYNEEYLPKFAKAPQESYDNLIKDYQLLNEIPADEEGYYYGFDTRNPNNIGLTKDNKLIMMDEIEYRLLPNTNTSGKLLKMFLLSITRAYVADEYKPIGKDAAKEIFKKIILASEKYNLTHDSDKDTRGIRCWELIFANFNIKKSAKAFINKLEKNRIKNPDIELRLKKTNEIIDKLFKNT